MLIYDKSVSYKTTDYVQFLCDRCGQSGIKRYDHILNGIGCPVCSNKKVLRGYNDLWTTNPEVASLLLKPEEGYNYTAHSGKTLEFKCPNCGMIKKYTVASITDRGLPCNRCSTGISYPNRLMAALLRFLHIDYKAEKTFPWSGKHRYDFYIYPDTIIEMQGGQHYKRPRGISFSPYEDILKNDIQKMQEALDNGIKNYLLINSMKSDVNYIAASIKCSRFPTLYNIDNVDWNEIEKQAMHNYYSQIVNLYNDGLTPSEIQSQIPLSINTIRRMLKTAHGIGDCVYDPIQNMLGNAINNCSIQHEKNKKPIRCITTGLEFTSINDAAAYYHITPKALSNCLCGLCKTSGKLGTEKLVWEYI